MEQSLNQDQKKAIEITDDHLLILAGAGSGKTKVITEKFKYLTDIKKISPYSILAITFTNKAANEMKSRIESLYDDQLPYLNIRTFHSFSSWVLRRYIEELNYNKNFTIIDSQDSSKIIKKLIKENLSEETHEQWRYFTQTISSLKNDLYQIDKTKTLPNNDSIHDLDIEEILTIYNLYQKYSKKYHLVDFDDLLVLCSKLLEESIVVKNDMRNRFHYLLVDEYQDTNVAQEKIINSLSKLDIIINVVGDEDQCIYSFRGSKIDNILSFPKNYSNVKVIELKENYRCTQNILNLANEVISINNRLYPKELYTKNEVGHLPKLNFFINKNNESNYIVQKIKYYIHEGYQYSDMAILYRVNSNSRFIEEKLISESIPYIVYGGLKFYDRKEIKDIIAYLQYLLNPMDINALSRIVNYPKRSIGTMSLNKIISFLENQNHDLYNSYTKLKSIISKKAYTNLVSFIEKMNHIRNQIEDLTVDKIVLKIIQEFNFKEEFEKSKDTMEYDKKIDNLNSFLDSCYEYTKRNTDTSLNTFINHISLQTDTNENSIDDSFVNLMTVHHAKGLEFPIVFVISMEDKNFPHVRSIEDDYLLEEERRLFYVAITRAKTDLHISTSLMSYGYNGYQEKDPSRFFDILKNTSLVEFNSEIDESLLQNNHEYF